MKTIIFLATLVAASSAYVLIQPTRPVPPAIGLPSPILPEIPAVQPPMIIEPGLPLPQVILQLTETTLHIYLPYPKMFIFIVIFDMIILVFLNFFVFFERQRKFFL